MINLQNLPTNKDYTIADLKCKITGNNGKLKQHTHGMIKLDDNGKYEFVNYQEKIKVEFSVEEAMENNLLRNFLSRNFYCVSELSAANQTSDTMFLHTVFFSEISDYPDFNIILSERVKEHLERKGIKSITDFEKNFLFNDGYHESMIAYTNGNYQDELFEEDKNGKEKQYRTNEHDEYNDSEDDEIVFQTLSKIDRRIKIYGSHKIQGYNIVLYVRMSEDSDNNMVLIGDKVVFGAANVPCFKAAASHLKFTEERNFISLKTRKLFEDTKDGYLSIWEKYTNLEGDIILDRAKNIGIIRIDSSNIMDKKTVLTVNERCVDNIKYLLRGDSLSFDETMPEYLIDTDMEWKNYKEIVLYERKNRKLSGKKCFEITGIDVKKRQITIDSSESIFGDSAVLSIYSELTQIIRRENARERIHKGESANPKLGMIIEGIVEPNVLSFSKNKSNNYPAMTELVRRKIFPNHPPTDNQKEAIGIAINTPDIALILGPPGTGKTTVINAIVERLNEIDDQSKCNRGKVLISSTQHDAVTNITERMSVNGIPTPKFGRKMDDENTSEMAVARWCERIKSDLSEKYSFIKEIKQKNELDRLFSLYCSTPSKGSAKAFLMCAEEINMNALLASEIELLLQEFANEENPSDTEDDTLKAIRRLRTKRLSFADDGPENLLELYIRLKDISGFSTVHPEIMDVIKKALVIDRDSLTKELSLQLKHVRDRLLELYLPKPKYKKEQVDERIIDLYNSLKNMSVSASDEEQDIILSLYNELDNNISLVEEQLSEYSYAYSSTLQQSVGKNITRVKLGDTHRGQGNNLIKYDTVIIDEAARATPGDLLIPLTQAVKRIILVGDPHQLTHVYNEDILNSLGEENDCSKLEDIQKSMFSYMWERAKQMEKTDGIKRTIVLNNQYRTHGLLGRFVSDNFYRPSGEEYNSPLPDSFFVQDIYDSPLRWIDFPNSCGPMTGSITYSRECEADYIVNKIIELKNSEKGKKYSYGVITFYRGQTKLIKNKMKEKYPDYEQDGIRIGSVDAFQGMEFDVIFLSIVRTGVKTFGFLTSVNRLCVAMSRQKKLLVVVGDSNMFSSEKAEEQIPSMKHLLEICIREGWVENYAAAQ